MSMFFNILAKMKQEGGIGQDVYLLAVGHPQYSSHVYPTDNSDVNAYFQETDIYYGADPIQVWLKFRDGIFPNISDIDISNVEATGGASLGSWNIQDGGDGYLLIEAVCYNEREIASTTYRFNISLNHGSTNIYATFDVDFHML